MASILREKVFDREWENLAFGQAFKYILAPEVSKYESGDSKGNGHSYSSRYGTYGGSQVLNPKI